MKADADTALMVLTKTLISKKTNSFETSIFILLGMIIDTINKKILM